MYNTQLIETLSLVMVITSVAAVESQSLRRATTAYCLQALLICGLIVAFAVFLLVSQMNKLKKQAEAPPAVPTTKECPFCLMTVPIKATRCPHCTSQLSA